MGGVRVASCKTAQSSARRPRSGTHLGTSAQTAAKGGVEKMTIYAMWKLTAEELWAMGYRNCEPEASPVPMTQYQTGWKSAEENRRGAKR
jgi:hypothetical protein